jgi:hypothetical protein
MSVCKHEQPAQDYPIKKTKQALFSFVSLYISMFSFGFRGGNK